VDADGRRGVIDRELSALEACEALPADTLKALSKQLNSIA
jgi:hypothetical protein